MANYSKNLIILMLGSIVIFQLYAYAGTASAIKKPLKKGGKEFIKLLGKKKFEERFIKDLKAKFNDIEFYPETAIRGGGPKGTRRADGVIIDQKRKTKTIVEVKSPKEIATGKSSWCSYNDYLYECRQKVVNKFGSCTTTAAWLIVVGCQANSNRTNQFKDEIAKNKFKDFEPRTGIAIPKESLDELLEALKSTGLNESDYLVKEIGKNALIELSEQSMDIISRFIN